MEEFISSSFKGSLILIGASLGWRYLEQLFRQSAGFIAVGAGVPDVAVAHVRGRIISPFGSRSIPVPERILVGNWIQKR